MKTLPIKKTKIVCTIGPASQDQAVLEQMIKNGMNIARINFAHGDADSHRQTVANVRAAAKAAGRRVAIFGDLPGPKMRIGKLDQESVELEQGDSFVLHTEEIVGNNERASIDFNRLPHVVNPQDSIFMNDGIIELTVTEVQEDEVHCTVKAGGELRSNKGVNFPGIDLGISAFTKYDQQCLKLAAELQLDGVSQSFVLSARDIKTVRLAATDLNYQPLIIAKIERSGALKYIDELIEAADAIMVARGDLGVEIPIENIPSVQKEIIRKTNLAGKPVITATQMLESMTSNRRPTRAEATDVANAIIDGTDCVMLSGETAVGRYPVETVSTMARIAQQTEATMPKFTIVDLLRAQKQAETISKGDLLSLIVFLTAEMLEPLVVLAPARSGGTARRLTRFRLPQWIISPSQYEHTCQRLQFSYGIFAVYVPDSDTLETPQLRREFARELLAPYMTDHGSDMVLVVEGAGTLRTADTKRIDMVTL
ncbi:MAG: pyruvate kinase [Candidatus Promineifilaceae bacterium]|nr:pyruvate kinase [Candidatus Promineifilaceae bacterium]